MAKDRKEQIRTLLGGIETGDPDAVLVIDPDTYIQHNPQTHEGREGLAALFKRLATTNPRVNIVRLFEDGDFVFGHTEYDFASRRIGFEVFRFDGDLTVEHWDNIQPRQGPNALGHSMVDGPTEVTDQAATETNRDIIRTFVQTQLIDQSSSSLSDFLNVADFTEHSPRLDDGLTHSTALFETLTSETSEFIYDRLHRLLAQGNFVLSVCEGRRQGEQTSFYDLYRLEKGKIVEHWDTIEKVPPASEWKNDNGKF
ncbi:nuclear transport factor 2 family protein [Rhodovibrionaceae bacterium A322]